MMGVTVCVLSGLNQGIDVHAPWTMVMVHGLFDSLIRRDEGGSIFE